MTLDSTSDSETIKSLSRGDEIEEHGLPKVHATAGVCSTTSDINLATVLAEVIYNPLTTKYEYTRLQASALQLLISIWPPYLRKPLATRLQRSMSTRDCRRLLYNFIYQFGHRTCGSHLQPAYNEVRVHATAGVCSTTSDINLATVLAEVIYNPLTTKYEYTRLQASALQLLISIWPPYLRISFTTRLQRSTSTRDCRRLLYNF
ncbi:hypothetical protein J6590_028664 [Homalodisca vitripennis]|nr:hypothetical protein J6590_028664 [Homalodisca vitripennis]